MIAPELLLKFTVMLRKCVWNLMRGKNKILRNFEIALTDNRRGKFDVLLSTLGISPDVIATSELGIAHQFIIGNPMAEMDIHSDAKFSKKLAHM